jgi:hypothetical protein
MGSELGRSVSDAALRVSNPRGQCKREKDASRKDAIDDEAQCKHAVPGGHSTVELAQSLASIDPYYEVSLADNLHCNALIQSSIPAVSCESVRGGRALSQSTQDRVIHARTRIGIICAF